ncbi:hypothetical protein MPSEU_001090200 [Mayamaea pseudoterrestris]|nr:hypothetical protein MPSEU_001090200 [Mayamaea pseudoterrestris]
MSSSRTFLRVRRQRSAASADAIYLQNIQTNGGIELNKIGNNRVAVWRKIDEAEHERENSRKRNYRVLDAVLEDDYVSAVATDNDILLDSMNYSARKRRKLTLLPCMTISNFVTRKSQSPRKQLAIRILHPTERLVDDSLQQVFQGVTSALEHYRLITQDSRLANEATKWLAWRNSSGSLLHACALWNEHDILHDVLRTLLRDSNTQSAAAANTCHAAYASMILDSLDADGRSPYQLAQLSGHAQVCELLEAYGAGDYLVDLYALDDEEMVDANKHFLEHDASANEFSAATDVPYISCDLHGGVGYWDDHGQLILEHAPPKTASSESLHDEESVDSNHEDWEGNDYPDYEFDNDYDHGENSEGADNEYLTDIVQNDEDTQQFGSYAAVMDPSGDFDAAYGIYGQAALYHEFNGPIGIETVDIPSVPVDGVLLQVRATGVCRSDWHGWKGHDADVRKHGLPFCPGHEVSGIVAKVGRDCRKFKVGDRVAVPFILSCGSCEYCDEHRPTVCIHQEQPGFTRHGSFAEYLALPRADRNLRLLPWNVSFVQAAALGCRFTTAHRAVMQQGKCNTNTSSVCIFGGGGLGLSCVMVAAAMNVTQIIAVDVSQAALTKSMELGATHTVLADDGVIDEIMRMTNHQGAPLTIDAAGFASTCESAILCTRRGGRMVQVGLPIGHAPPQIPMGLVVGREIEIVGSHGASADTVGELLQLVASGKLDPSRVVERQVSLEEGIQVLQSMDKASPLGMTMITSFTCERSNTSRL